MRIFKCEADNLDDIAAFYDRVTEYLEKNVNYPKWTRGGYPCRESAAEAIADGVQYACEDVGKIVGAFILNDNPQGDYRCGGWSIKLNKGEYLVIHTLATDPMIYHKGIGTHMVKYCIDAAKSLGYKAVRLDVVPTNTPAKGLYKRMGFTFAGRRDLKRGIAEIPEFDLYEFNL